MRAEISVSAHMIPVGMCDEDGCQFRQVWRIRSQCLVGSLGRVRARARIDADQFSPIVRHYKIIFGELETRERIYTARDYLCDAPRGKSVPGCDLFGKRSDQCNRPVKVFVATPPQIVLCLGLVSVSKSEFSEVVIDFSQPAGMRGFVSVRYAPSQLVLRRLLLMEEGRKLGIYDAGNPVHHENLPSGKLPGLVEYRDRIFHVANSVQQRNLRCMLSSQQSDCAQIQRLLSVR